MSVLDLLLDCESVGAESCLSKQLAADNDGRLSR